MELHKLIGEYLALNFLGFKTVESSGFKHFISKLQPLYNIPSRIFFSQKVMPSIYHSLKRDVQIVVNAAKFISFTTDGWSSRYSQDSFQSFTAHCISESGDLQSVLLASKYFETAHTSKDITDMIHDIHREYCIPAEKVVCIVSDNANVMIKAVIDSGYSHLGCFLHNLQLVVNHGLFEQAGISNIISKIRSIVTLIHRSNKARRELKKIQKDIGKKGYKLSMDIPTR